MVQSSQHQLCTQFLVAKCVHQPFAHVYVCRQLHLFARQHTKPSLVFRSLLDRKSTRLNSSHVSISYAVFCLKKKTDNADIARRSVLISVGTNRSIGHVG